MRIFRKQKLIDIDLEIKAASLNKSLTVYDLIMLGIGAVIGVGAFVLTGVAAAKFAGPAIVISYLIAGFVCLFVGLLYAELASIMPTSGSAYSYAYTSMGEIIAWLVFWFLMMEYTTGSGMIAIGFGGYCAGILKSFNIHIPDYLLHSPLEGGLINLPSFLIVWMVIPLLIKGTKESSWLNIVLVIVKILAILIFVAIAIPSFNFEYWENFMPYGIRGVGTGAATLILSYVGFDQLANATEEAKNPKRDLPIAIFVSLAICAILYISIAASMTLIAPYQSLDNAEPMAYALRINGSNIGSSLVAVGALAGIITSLIVQVYGQSRSIFAISRDGLMPIFLSKVHKDHRTPHVSTILVGILISLVAAFVPLEFIGRLASVGALVSFIAVTMGVVIMRKTHADVQRSFKCPYVYIVATISMISCCYLLFDLLINVWEICVLWIAIGLAIYFKYSYKNSILGKSHS